MAFFSRRRRLKTAVFICCLLALFYVWYSKTEYIWSPTRASDAPSSTDPLDSIREQLLKVATQSKLVITIRWRRPYTLPLTTSKYDDYPIPAQSGDEASTKEDPYREVAFPSPGEHKHFIPIWKLPSDQQGSSGSTEYDDKLTTKPVTQPPSRVFPASGQDRTLDTTQRLRRTTDIVQVNVVRKDETIWKTTGLPVTESTTNPNLILDTPGCQIPKLDPWDPTVRHLIELQDPYVCPGPPLFMKSKADGSIALNASVLKQYYNIEPHEIECHYEPILRSHEDLDGMARENHFRKDRARWLKFGEPLNEDYVGANCKLGNVTFEQYFPLIRLKKEVERERNQIPPPNPKLNIVLVGIDSVSKLNFLRHFNKTHTFLNEILSPFDMNGYTKVGDNTFPNLVPMLTGHFVEHYWNESLMDIMYFDDLDFIWKDYAKKGFRTFYAEDNPKAGTFNYLKRGFYNPPTDYYFRPLALALELSKLSKEMKKAHCLHSQIEPDLIFDYLRDFLKAMGPRPYHAFAMVSNITHDVLNHAGWADEPTVRLLEDMHRMGALNSSLIVLFSDHGIRFGKIRFTYIGKIEERMPFMYIHVPEWFRDQYPGLTKNLRTNQNRLMTLFDIHATMIHLLDLNKTPEERSVLSEGLSLLDEIPSNRTCAEANILPHWCPCQTFSDVALDSPEVINASQAILDDINSKLESYGGMCEVLEVDRIMDARVAHANDLVLRYLRRKNPEINSTFVFGERVKPVADYMITVVAKPGGAVFEGTVRQNPQHNSFDVLGISRINLYGSTSWCIDSQKMKIYCYCKIQNPFHV